MSKHAKNGHDSREDWLRAATDLIRPEFEAVGAPLPERMRFAVAFTSQGKRAGKITGEAWPAEASADGTHEIILRCDKADPHDAVGILVHELVHTITGTGHGKEYRDLALKIGLSEKGGIRHAMPGPRLVERLKAIVDQLGPLPHARLNFDTFGVADKPKKQGTRMLKAYCTKERCGYVCRVAAVHVDNIGAPVCPREGHGPMNVERPDEDAGDQDAAETPTIAGDDAADAEVKGQLELTEAGNE